jgi:hypothetical protein
MNASFIGRVIRTNYRRLQLVEVRSGGTRILLHAQHLPSARSRKTATRLTAPFAAVISSSRQFDSTNKPDKRRLPRTISAKQTYTRASLGCEGNAIHGANIATRSFVFLDEVNELGNVKKGERAITKVSVPHYFCGVCGRKKQMVISSGRRREKASLRQVVGIGDAGLAI